MAWSAKRRLMLAHQTTGQNSCRSAKLSVGRAPSKVGPSWFVCSRLLQCVTSRTKICLKPSGAHRNCLRSHTMVFEYLAHTMLSAVRAQGEIQKLHDSYILLEKQSEHWPQKDSPALRMCNQSDSELANTLETPTGPKQARNLANRVRTTPKITPKIRRP